MVAASTFAGVFSAGAPTWLLVLLWVVFGYCVFRFVAVRALRSRYVRALLLARIAGVSLGMGGAWRLLVSRHDPHEVVQALVAARSAALDVSLNDVLTCADSGVSPEDAVCQYVVRREKGFRGNFAKYCELRKREASEGREKA
jgi:uncharacterized protein YqfA (UPF0365 family)